MLLERARDQAAACLRLDGGTNRRSRWDISRLTPTASSIRQSLLRRRATADRRRRNPTRQRIDQQHRPARPHPLAARRDEFYRAVHGCLVEVLAGLGITAPDVRRRPTRSRPPGEPFLCFRRRSPGDVLIGQRQDLRQRPAAAGARYRGAVLQHGSLLWRTSPSAPELPGRGGSCYPPDRVRKRWPSCGWRPCSGDWDSFTREDELAEERSAGSNPCGNPLFRGKLDWESGSIITHGG